MLLNHKLSSWGVRKLRIYVCHPLKLLDMKCICDVCTLRHFYVVHELSKNCHDIIKISEPAS